MLGKHFVTLDRVFIDCWCLFYVVTVIYHIMEDTCNLKKNFLICHLLMSQLVWWKREKAYTTLFKILFRICYNNTVIEHNKILWAPLHFGFYFIYFICFALSTLWNVITLMWQGRSNYLVCYSVQDVLCHFKLLH